MSIIVEDVACPVCQSIDQVAVCKVNIDGQWWHRCCAGDHGDYRLPNGEVHPFPDYPYFHDNIVETNHGNLPIIAKEEWQRLGAEL